HDRKNRFCSSHLNILLRGWVSNFFCVLELACRSDPPWRPVEFPAVSARRRNDSIPRHSLTPPELRGGARVSVVRVRENYHSGLLIGSDSKMNGTLNSEAAGRKILRTVDFSAAWQSGSGASSRLE